MMPTKIWYKNPTILFKEPFNFLPNRSMSTTQALNASFKLCVYVSIILFCLQKHEKGLFVVIAGALMTAFVDHIGNVEKGSYTYNTNVNVIKPTEANPFMNITLDEYSSSKSREVDSGYNNVYEDETIKADMENAFNVKLHQNTSDIFGKYNSQRQFYTMPVTTIPNKQVEFAKWLYGEKGKTCKEGDQSKCTAFLSPQEL